MIYDIEWQLKAVRQFEKIKDHVSRVTILDAVNTLAFFPNRRQIKALSKHHYGYRLRAGQYRVLFNVVDVVHIVMIEEVKKRNERTYSL